MALLVVTAVNVHAITHLKEGLGYSVAQASFFITLMTVGQAAGVGLGYLIGDHFQKRYVAAWCMLMHAVGLLMLTYATGPVMLVVFAALHGVAWGLRGPFMQAIRADYFGREAKEMLGRTLAVEGATLELDEPTVVRDADGEQGGRRASVGQHGLRDLHPDEPLPGAPATDAEHVTLAEGGRDGELGRAEAQRLAKHLTIELLRRGVAAGFVGELGEGGLGRQHEATISRGRGGAEHLLSGGGGLLDPAGEAEGLDLGELVVERSLHRQDGLARGWRGAQRQRERVEAGLDRRQAREGGDGPLRGERAVREEDHPQRRERVAALVEAIDGALAKVLRENVVERVDAEALAPA